jgi:hypothetical protein
MYGSMVEPQSQDRVGTTWGPSHGWRLAGFHTKSAGFAVVHHKTTRFLGWATKQRTKTEALQHQVGLTGEEHRSDRCAPWAFEDFEAEDTHWDHKACIEAKQGAVAGHPSDGAMMRSSQSALRGRLCYFHVIGVVSSFSCLHINQLKRGWQLSLGTLVHLLPSFPFFP